ncbi:hypothetical protein [Roseicyclus persicicus]|uniref:Uncharacterized protein n=1 Tax=Roseicyclus persicicus TaxID=2650661 RepID=A0A7X6GZR1_9RHOB|nr:hypothetical protein [Roseibacterium persicicum]NKX44734.1 hypothetical protein [Roseibacterium persicicum]
MTQTDPKPARKAHTELRRGKRDEPEAAPAAPATPKLQPRTSAETLAKTLEDGADDLFNDMPV